MALVLFSTDNFIISKVFSPADVVPYNMAHKYFSIAIRAYTIIVTPYWSTFTQAYVTEGFDWIKKSVRNIQRLWLLISLCLFFMLLLADWFYVIWFGVKLSGPLSLSILMALFSCYLLI